MRECPEAVAILCDGIAARAFPAAAVEVGRRSTVLWREAFGALTYDADAAATTTETIFDLASLTKVIATTTLTMRAVDDGRLALDDRIGQRLAEWRGLDREEVTIRDLLSHSAGLSSYLPFFRDYTGRIEFEQAICTLPLEYPPRSRAVYSDLGFMLLGFILDDADRSGRRVMRPDRLSSLVTQFARLASLITQDPLAYNPPRAWRNRIAPTEIDPWRGRLLVGETHDENAWALGGVAGHAGLFGTVTAVGAFARAVLRTIAGEAMLAAPRTIREFILKTGTPGSSRALGWDTMMPTSSCGTRLSRTSIGHTGFTGTSLWIDWERDLYIVLLTNRVYPTRDNEAIRQIRPQFHDAVVKEVNAS